MPPFSEVICSPRSVMSQVRFFTFPAETCGTSPAKRPGSRFLLYQSLNLPHWIAGRFPLILSSGQSLQRSDSSRSTAASSTSLYFLQAPH